MAYFRKLYIDRYRGIKALKIDELKGVNLVVGDNNCGKTSVLEAIQLLRTSGNLANVYRVSRLRDSIAVLFLIISSVCSQRERMGNVRYLYPESAMTKRYLLS